MNIQERIEEISMKELSQIDRIEAKLDLVLEIELHLEKEREAVTQAMANSPFGAILAEANKG